MPFDAAGRESHLEGLIEPLWPGKKMTMSLLDEIRKDRGMAGEHAAIRTESKPTCPKCGHGLTDDEMHDHQEDLWGLAPNEGRTEISCPACGRTYHCQGGYRPEYTTALHEDDL
jgi:predicted RNA-binding Zn-ribbon protein involved in translation (DUF1610 family)